MDDLFLLKARLPCYTHAVCVYVCARHMVCKAYASMSGHFEIISLLC